MNKTLNALLMTTALMAGLAAEAQAAAITYKLDQSNIETVMPDGNLYLTVTIEDAIYLSDNNAIKFTVDVVNSAFTAGSNFGIQAFGFNKVNGAPPIADSNIVAPTGWTGNVAPPNNQLDGFGRFLGATEGTGQNRLEPLVFWITGVNGDTINSYVAPSSGNAGQGNQYFAAHVAGFTTADKKITSGYFGGSTVVPVPAAVWLFGTALAGMISMRRRNS